MDTTSPTEYLPVHRGQFLYGIRHLDGGRTEVDALTVLYVHERSVDLTDGVRAWRARHDFPAAPAWPRPVAGTPTRLLYASRRAALIAAYLDAVNDHEQAILAVERTRQRVDGFADAIDALDGDDAP